jgi:hypothetical protein
MIFILNGKKYEQDFTMPIYPISKLVFTFQITSSALEYLTYFRQTTARCRTLVSPVSAFVTTNLPQKLHSYYRTSFIHIVWCLTGCHSKCLKSIPAKILPVVDYNDHPVQYECHHGGVL